MQDQERKVSVIDLGTNTFHIVIFQKLRTGNIVEIYRKRHHVFLSENGIETIGDESMKRAKTAILDFQKNINEYSPDTLAIVGTAALRRASNGPILKTFIEEKLKTAVQVISGKREAELIAKGVQWEMQTTIENSIIVDIGGGSVEFIHIKKNELKWLQSFPIGVGVLYNQFGHEDTISLNDITEIRSFLDDKTIELSDYLSNNFIHQLIGSSGSFELIPSIIEGKYPSTHKINEITIGQFELIRDQLYNSTYRDRLTIDGLPKERAKLVTVAFILMDWFIEKSTIKTISISKFAVKEGLVAEILGNV